MTNIKLRAVANLDDVHLTWDPGEAIPGCLGFALECKRGAAKPKYISNRVGFRDDPALDDEGNPVRSRSSQDWPFQRYNWTDHAADLGHKVSYRVVARVKGDGGALIDGPASDWTPMLELSADCGNGISAYFNRGFVLSQFMARYMKKHGITLETLKKKAIEIGTLIDGEARLFLGGELRKKILGLLAEVEKKPKARLHAALYELLDDELVDALAKLGARASIVLANGSVEKAGEDQNHKARKQLRDAGVEVLDRMISPKALGHNKFLVLGSQTTSGFKPKKVWTGSTNWTPTGLCTQLNNGLLIENQEIADRFEAQFQLLARAKSGFPEELVATNSKPTRGVALGEGTTDIWFTRLRKRIDIDELVNLVKSAKQGIFYVMFQPGSEPVQTLLARQEEKDIYVRGVATRFTGAGKEQFTLLKKNPQTYSLKTVEATGVGSSIGKWAVEGTAQGFQGAVGHAITHCKVIVIDPFGDDPIVVTGSHNFSISASEKNDENFVVIRGEKRLAEHYAVSCMQTYNHYRWRAYLAESKAEGRPPFEFLAKTDKWQKRLTSAETKAMLRMWLP